LNHLDRAIFRSLPTRKQVMAFSATFPPDILKMVEGLMHNPQSIRLVNDTPVLLGIHT